MVKKKQTSIDGLKPKSARAVADNVVKNTTVKSLKASTGGRRAKSKAGTGQKKKAAKKAEVSNFDVKITKRRTTPEELVVADEIKIEEAEIEQKSVEEARAEFLEPVEAFDVEKMSKKETKKLEKERRKELKEAEKAAKKEKKKVSTARKIITSVLLVIVLLLIGGVVYLLIWGNDLIAKLTGGNSDIWSAISTVVTEHYEPLKTDENGRTNILVFGTSGYDMEGDSYDGVHDGAQLTDSIMMVSLDQETGDVAMVSLPRDLKGPATCTATGKINEVFWCADTTGKDEAKAAEALEEAVSSILGVEFQYRVHLNWGALVDIVDSIGGIKVTLDEDINDYYWTEAVYEAGVEYELNGEEALGLARARHGTQMGDFTRGNSQQKILIAIKEKILKNGVDLGEITGLFSTLGDNIRTNFSIEDIKTGVHLLQELDFENFRQLPMIDYENGVSLMTTAEIGGISYVIPSAGVGNYSIIKQYVAQNLSSDPAEREGAKILVLNGTGETGAAGTETERLAEELKIKSAKTDDAPEGEYLGHYTLYATDEGKKPETKKILEKFYEQEATDEEDLPEGISGYGWDFIIIIGSSEEAN